MNKFEYRHPEQPKANQLEGLSTKARESLLNLALGESTSEQLIGPKKSGLENLDINILIWASRELESDGNGFMKWQKYGGQFSTPIPSSLNDLAINNPNFNFTINRLYRANEILNNENLPNGSRGSMNLVLLPWQEIKNSLLVFHIWMDSLRRSQVGLLTKIDSYDDNLLNLIIHDEPLYRNVLAPKHLLTSTQYLDQKIARDGPWGVMLAQTNPKAGLRLESHVLSPDDWTAEGYRHLLLNKYAVDQMGIYEWISLTLQLEPDYLSTNDSSWLLANRTDIRNVSYVPIVGSDNGSFDNYIELSSMRNAAAFPRLAVL